MHLSRVIFALAILALAAVPSIHARPFRKTFDGALNVGDRRSHLLNAQVGDYQLFSTKLDNINGQSSQQFNLRYLVNDTFFQPGGPVLFVLGGEGTMSPAYVSGKFIVNEYAQELGGLIVALEHRFYGDSLPNGPNSETPVSLLKFLSSQQALADAAAFQSHIIAQFDLTPDNKWVVFGGSYSGCLSAWAKFTYPTLFAGAISSSAPVHALLDFYQYFEVVQNSVGGECAGALNTAVSVADALLDSVEGRMKLQGLFNLCAPMQDERDYANFMETISDPIAGAVQYSGDNNAQGQTFNISAVCSVMLAPNTDPLAQLAQLAAQQNAGNACLDVSYANMIAGLQNTSASRSWVWQTCTEFGFYQTGESNAQPFSKRITLDWFVQQCADIYGIPGLTPNTDGTNQYYESTSIQTSNTFFSNGNVDPWHALGVLSGSHGPNTNYHLINGTAHCADLYASSPRDLPELTQVRGQQLAAIKQWIGF